MRRYMEEKTHKKRIALYAMLTFLIMCFIFIMSAQDGDESGNLSNSFLGSLIGEYLEEILPPLSNSGAAYDIRKYTHMFEYLCLGISSSLLMFELLLYRYHRMLRAPIFAYVFCFFYACTDEWHQTFVPGRVGAFSDVLVDSIGFFVGILTISCAFFAKLLDKRGKKR